MGDDNNYDSNDQTDTAGGVPSFTDTMGGPSTLGDAYKSGGARGSAAARGGFDDFATDYYSKPKSGMLMKLVVVAVVVGLVAVAAYFIYNAVYNSGSGSGSGTGSGGSGSSPTPPSSAPLQDPLAGRRLGTGRPAATSTAGVAAPHPQTAQAHPPAVSPPQPAAGTGGAAARSLAAAAGTGAAASLSRAQIVNGSPHKGRLTPGTGAEKDADLDGLLRKAREAIGTPQNLHDIALHQRLSLDALREQATAGHRQRPAGRSLSPQSAEEREILRRHVEGLLPQINAAGGDIRGFLEARGMPQDQILVEALQAAQRTGSSSRAVGTSSPIRTFDINAVTMAARKSEDEQAIVAQAMRPIPAQSGPVAAMFMKLIVDARKEAAAKGVAVPPLTPEHLAAARAHAASSEAGTANAAKALLAAVGAR